MVLGDGARERAPSPTTSPSTPPASPTSAPREPARSAGSGRHTSPTTTSSPCPDDLAPTHPPPPARKGTRHEPITRRRQRRLAARLRPTPGLRPAGPPQDSPPARRRFLEAARPLRHRRHQRLVRRHPRPRPAAAPAASASTARSALSASPPRCSTARSTASGAASTPTSALTSTARCGPASPWRPWWPPPWAPGGRSSMRPSEPPVEGVRELRHQGASLRPPAHPAGHRHRDRRGRPRRPALPVHPRVTLPLLRRQGEGAADDPMPRRVAPRGGARTGHRRGRHGVAGPGPGGPGARWARPHEPVDPAPRRRTRPAQTPPGGPHHRPGLRRPPRRALRPSMFVTLTLPCYGPIVPGTGVPATPAATTTGAPPWTPCTSPSCSTGGSRTCAAAPATRSSTSAPSRPNAASPRTSTSPSAAPSPEPPSGPSPRPPTSSSGGRRSSSPSTPTDRRSGTAATTSTPTPRSPLPTWDAGPGRSSMTIPTPHPMHVMRVRAADRHQGPARRHPRRRPRRPLPHQVPHQGRRRDLHRQAEPSDAAYEDHIDRLHAEVRYLPCSPDCANWLRFGIQPRTVGPGLIPGRCPGKAHDRDNLGVGGRRVLVSRGWSGKTLRDHRADRSAVVREALEAAGIDVASAQRMAAQVVTADGAPRYDWSVTICRQATTAAVLMTTILERRRWREQYELAKSVLAANGPPVETNSATVGAMGGRAAS